MKKLIIITIFLTSTNVLGFAEQTSKDFPTGSFEVDFGICTAGHGHKAFALGSISYEILGKKNENCILRYGVEVENPAAFGLYNTFCLVPVKFAKQEFMITDFRAIMDPHKFPLY